MQIRSFSDASNLPPPFPDKKGGDVKAEGTHPDFMPAPNTAKVSAMEKDAIIQDIEDTVKTEPVVVFMKGLPEAPVCSFSRILVDILDQLGLEYTSFDVLAHPIVRSHVKVVSGWPTIPQLFVKGKFVGGCDLVQEMAANGDLQRMLEKEGIEHRSVKIPRRT
jgi:monothiol glutaredoxin